jgi:tRNA-dihydrouridine synthase B
MDSHIRTPRPLSSASRGYAIRDVAVQPGLVLAPMSGVTTRPFRRLIKELNPGAVGLVISEFVSVEGMTRGSRRTLEMMRFHESERPYGVQIFGYDITRMRDAASMVQDLGVDIVDINCGCPAPKVVKKGGGCELMRQPEHLARIIKAVRQAISVPLTMKFRSGWDEHSKNAVEVAHIAESEGVEAVTVHGRTRAQLYRGAADWSVVQQVSDAVSIPVCGSGDVVDSESARDRRNEGVAGLYIGRASMWNPLVFTEIAFETKTDLKQDQMRMVAILQRYAELLREDFQDGQCAGKLKQLASQMCRGALWRKELLTLNSFTEQCTLLERVKLGEWQPQNQYSAEAEPKTNIQRTRKK